MPIIPGSVVVNANGTLGNATIAPATADSTARAIMAELTSTANFGADNDHPDMTFTFPQGAEAVPLLRGYASLANRIGAVVAQPSRTPVGAGAYAVLVSDVLVAKTGITGGGDAITIPNNATLRDGRSITFKDESGTATANNITITATGLTIDGAANYVINVNFGKVTLYSDGTNWFTR